LQERPWSRTLSFSWQRRSHPGCGFENIFVSMNVDHSVRRSWHDEAQSLFWRDSEKFVPTIGTFTFRTIQLQFDSKSFPCHFAL
jgi:hypothetical protein